VESLACSCKEGELAGLVTILSVMLDERVNWRLDLVVFEKFEVVACASKQCFMWAYFT
jgi:hypothetical protein